MERCKEREAKALRVGERLRERERERERERGGGGGIDQGERSVHARFMHFVISKLCEYRYRSSTMPNSLEHRLYFCGLDCRKIVNALSLIVSFQEKFPGSHCFYLNFLVIFLIRNFMISSSPCQF